MERRAGEFFVMTSRIASDPNMSVTEMAKVARGPALRVYSDELIRTRGRGERMSGPLLRVYQVQLGVPSEGDEGRIRIPVSLCVDARGVDLIDESGKSVNVPGRPDSFPKEVWLEEWPNDWYVVDEKDGKHQC